jgi:hypothetical protein
MLYRFLLPPILEKLSKFPPELGARGALIRAESLAAGKI